MRSVVFVLAIAPAFLFAGGAQAAGAQTVAELLALGSRGFQVVGRGPAPSAVVLLGRGAERYGYNTITGGLHGVGELDP